jgi:GNAT superfamily N-acetyltransferase
MSVNAAPVRATMTMTMTASGGASSAIHSLRGREAEPAIATLLALAQVHRSTDEAAERGPIIAHQYASSDDLRLYGFEERDSIIGLIGIAPIGDKRAIVRDLAVAPDAQLRGIGRAVIDHLRHDLGYTSLEGDTLAPAIAFYGRCGFVLRADGMMPDGATRYRFSWNAERHLYQQSLSTVLN